MLLVARRLHHPVEGHEFDDDEPHPGKKGVIASASEC
jgi:hypothetical protein